MLKQHNKGVTRASDTEPLKKSAKLEKGPDITGAIGPCFFATLRHQRTNQRRRGLRFCRLLFHQRVGVPPASDPPSVLRAVLILQDMNLPPCMEC